MWYTGLCEPYYKDDGGMDEKLRIRELLGMRGHKE
jgi:hypothetical protein